MGRWVGGLVGDRQYLIFSKILFHPSFFDLIYIRLILNKEWRKKTFNILCLKQYHLSNSNSFFKSFYYLKIIMKEGARIAMEGG